MLEPYDVAHIQTKQTTPFYRIRLKQVMKQVPGLHVPHLSNQTIQQTPLFANLWSSTLTQINKAKGNNMGYDILLPEMPNNKKKFLFFYFLIREYAIMN